MCYISLLCFNLIAFANTTPWLVFCVYIIPCSTTFVIFVQYLLCIIFVFVVFTLINKYDTFQWLLRYVHTHARTHAHTHARTCTHAHYDILSDIMIILDHGNMCRHHFHDIVMHNFPDIEEIRFFDNGGPNLHTHICIFIRQHFLTMRKHV